LFEGEVLSLPLRAGQNLPAASGTSVAISGKLPDGSTTSCNFDLVATDAPALPLLWAKRRIDFLLAQSRTQAAIALAKEANLVCEGTAFIAWDETEKVPVSGPEQQLYQPAMMTKLFAAARMASPGIVAGKSESRSETMGLMEETSFLSRFQSRRGSQGLRRPSPDDALRELSRFRGELATDPLFQTPAGLELLDVIFAWAGSSRAQAIDRSHLIGDLLVLLHQTSHRPVTERLDLLRKWIEQNMEEPFRNRALTTLRRLEAEARGQVGSPSP
jgi:hypothetical protein